MKYFFLLFIFLTMTSCRLYMDKEAGLYINNISELDLYVGTGADSISSFEVPPGYEFDSFNFCEQGTKKYIRVTGLFWDEYFKFLKSETLSIFLLDSDTVHAYDIKTLKNEYKIKCRYDVTLDDLESLKYTLIYPPTPTMRDIKMWPPYSTFEK